MQQVDFNGINISNLAIIAGNSNPELFQSIEKLIQQKKGCEGFAFIDADISTFPDGEICVEIHENLRGKDVYILQSVCGANGRSVNDHLMELLVITDACKRAACNKLTLVIPHYGYARQDRKTRPRQPITAALVTNMYHQAGADKIITMDLHAAQIQGHGKPRPMDNLFARPVFLDFLMAQKDLSPQEVVFVSPDAGGVERVVAMAKRYGCELAFLYKKRVDGSTTDIISVVGEEKVKGKDAFLIDDILGTGGSAVRAAVALEEIGAKSINFIGVHGMFSGEAVVKIEKSPIKTVYVTDSAPLSEAAKGSSKIEIITGVDIIGQAILCDYTGKSVSALFE